MIPTEAEHILTVIETIDAELASQEAIAARLDRSIEHLLEAFDCRGAFLWFTHPVERGGLSAPVIHTRSGVEAIESEALIADHWLRELVAEARDSGEVSSVGPDAREVASTSCLAQHGVESVQLLAVEPRLGPGWVMGILDAKSTLGLALSSRLLVRIGQRMGEAVGSHMMMEHLQRAEARTHELLGQSKDALLVIDLGTQRIIEANERAELLFGWPVGQLLGVELAQLQPEHQPGGEASEMGITLVLAQVGAGSSESFAWTFRQAGGQELACKVDMSPVPNSERLLIHTSITAA